MRLDQCDLCSAFAPDLAGRILNNNGQTNLHNVLAREIPCPARGCCLPDHHIRDLEERQFLPTHVAAARHLFPRNSGAESPKCIPLYPRKSIQGIYHLGNGRGAHRLFNPWRLLGGFFLPSGRAGIWHCRHHLGCSKQAADRSTPGGLCLRRANTGGVDARGNTMAISSRGGLETPLTLLRLDSITY
jgi:hypothetical protein